MSPRAACRLESFGFERVYDYVAGIADWKAAGLPTEGEGHAAQRVADATRADAPTCSPDESVGAARARTTEAGWQECVVLDCGGMVVGRLRNESWNATDDTSVSEAMENGPTTVRPDGLLEPLVGRMEKRGTGAVLVTTPQGELLGALLAEEARRLLTGEKPERIWQDCEGCPGRWIVKA